jgi:hypothetical protein
MPILATDKPTFATSAGHWYKPSGEPAYTVIGANGKERATTLRDARKLGLYPSVTTITKLAAKPGLERWKAEQLMMSALTLQQMPMESEQSWIGRVWQDSIQQAARAAERGTRIHAAIEKSYRGESYDPEFKPWVTLARQVIGQAFPDESWSAERSFAHPLGYGGKVDLHSKRVLIDMKSKDGDLCDVGPYDENVMQVAAYGDGLELVDPTCAILFVSRQEPIVKLTILKNEEVARGAAMFKWLLFYWKAVNRL